MQVLKDFNNVLPIPNFHNKDRTKKKTFFMKILFVSKSLKIMVRYFIFPIFEFEGLEN